MDSGIRRNDLVYSLSVIILVILNISTQNRHYFYLKTHRRKDDDEMDVFLLVED